MPLVILASGIAVLFIGYWIKSCEVDALQDFFLM
jgi:hypothetical protein